MFYDNFINLCAQRGIAPSAAAVAMGFQKSVVTRWKKNGSTPTDANLQKIAAYFGVPKSALLSDGPDAAWQDELIGLYGEVRAELTDADIADIKTMMRLRAELNATKGGAEKGK